MYKLAQALGRHGNFISAHAAATYNSPESHQIEQRRHPTAGLIYSHISPMQTARLTKAKPAFALHDKQPSIALQDKQRKRLFSFAGVCVSTPKEGPHPLFKLDRPFGIEKDRIQSSVAKLRLTRVPSFSPPPVTVGRKHSSLSDVEFHLSVTSRQTDEEIVGSREYNAREKFTPRMPRFFFHPMPSVDEAKQRKEDYHPTLYKALHSLLDKAERLDERPAGQLEEQPERQP